MQITTGVYDAIISDLDIAALLAEFEGEPAVFTIFPVPEDSGSPYVTIAGPVIDQPWDTKTSLGRDSSVDVRVWDLRRGSTLDIDIVSQMIRDRLHRIPIEVDNYGWVLSIASGPIVADTVDAYGRLITVMFRMLKEV